MRKIPHYNCSIVFEYEDEENNRTLEFTIYGDAEPYVPAQLCGPPERCYPAEGGYAEVVEVELISATGEDGDLSLTIEERVAIEEYFTAKIEGNPALAERISDELCEDAEAGCDDHYDY